MAGAELGCCGRLKGCGLGSSGGGDISCWLMVSNPNPVQTGGAVSACLPHSQGTNVWVLGLQTWYRSCTAGYVIGRSCRATLLWFPYWHPRWRLWPTTWMAGQFRLSPRSGHRWNDCISNYHTMQLVLLCHYKVCPTDQFCTTSAVNLCLCHHYILK